MKFVDSVMAPGITPSWVAKERIEEAEAIMKEPITTTIHLPKEVLYYVREQEEK